MIKIIKIIITKIKIIIKDIIIKIIITLEILLITTMINLIIITIIFFLKIIMKMKMKYTLILQEIISVIQNCNYTTINNHNNSTHWIIDSGTGISP